MSIYKKFKSNISKIDEFYKDSKILYIKKAASLKIIELS